jgi:hypothetical protein
MQIWHCPSTDLALTDIDGKIVCHYGWNAYYLNQGIDVSNIYSLNNAAGVTLAAVMSPAHTVIMTDNRGINGKIPANHLSTYVLPPSQPDADYWGRPEPRHSAGVVVGLLDGHMKWLHPGAFYTGQSPADSWFSLNQP